MSDGNRGSMVMISSFDFDDGQTHLYVGQGVRQDDGHVDDGPRRDVWLTTGQVDLALQTMGLNVMSWKPDPRDYIADGGRRKGEHFRIRTASVVTTR